MSTNWSKARWTFENSDCISTNNNIPLASKWCIFVYFPILMVNSSRPVINCLFVIMCFESSSNSWIIKDCFPDTVLTPSLMVWIWALSIAPKIEPIPMLVSKLAIRVPTKRLDRVGEPMGGWYGVILNWS